MPARISACCLGEKGDQGTCVINVLRHLPTSMTIDYGDSESDSSASVSPRQHPSQLSSTETSRWRCLRPRCWFCPAVMANRSIRAFRCNTESKQVAADGGFDLGLRHLEYQPPPSQVKGNNNSTLPPVQQNNTLKKQSPAFIVEASVVVFSGVRPVQFFEGEVILQTPAQSRDKNQESERTERAGISYRLKFQREMTANGMRTEVYTFRRDRTVTSSHTD